MVKIISESSELKETFKHFLRILKRDRFTQISVLTILLIILATPTIITSILTTQHHAASSDSASLENNISTSSAGVNSFPKINEQQMTKSNHIDVQNLEKYLVVEAALLGVGDNISFYFNDLNTNKEITKDPNRSWIPASTIKTFVVLEAFRQRDIGQVNFDQQITIQAQNIVSTELETTEFPVLQEGTKVTIRQLVESMIIQSDNTAYNSLLDILDRRNINQTLRNLGITETVVGEKLNLDDNQFQQDLAAAGRQPNTTTVKDLATFFSLLYTKQVADADEILSIFKRQKINNMIPALIPTSTTVAHKTGDWAPIYHDGGVIYKPNNPFIFVAFTNSDDPNIIAKLAHVAYFQTAESVGLTPTKDAAYIIPKPQLIAYATLNSLPRIPKVLSAQAKITFLAYSVQKGDTLSSIAQHYYNDPNRWVDIAQRNNINTQTDISPGQQLFIPFITTSPAQTRSPTITAADLGITTQDLTIDSQDVKKVNNATISPDSLFYGFKKFFESIQLAKSQSTSDKINVYLNLALNRLSEAKTMLNNGDTTHIQQLLDDSESNLQQATLIARSSNATQAQLIRIKQLSDLHFATLAQTSTHIPDNKKVQFVDAVYNFYKKNQQNISPTLNSHVIANPIQQKPLIGTIKSVTSTVATMQFDNGTTKDILLSNTTPVRDFHSNVIDYQNNLTQGAKVAVVGETTANNNIIPLFILRNIPKDLPDKHEGTVININPLNNELVIMNKQGQKEQVSVSDNTTVRAKDTGVSLEGIKPGSEVTIYGETKSDAIPSQVISPTISIAPAPNETSAILTPNINQTKQSQKITLTPTYVPPKTTISNPTLQPLNHLPKIQSVTRLNATTITVTKNDPGNDTTIIPLQKQNTTLPAYQQIKSVVQQTQPAQQNKQTSTQIPPKSLPPTTAPSKNSNTPPAGEKKK